MRRTNYSVLIALLLLLLFPINLWAVTYSPAYRAKSALDENGIGFYEISASLTLPGNDDITGIEETGAAYNYLGIETGNGNSFEIGLHKDSHDKACSQWSVFAYANYRGAYADYGSQERWHNFRTGSYNLTGPNMVIPDGSTISMTLRIVEEGRLIFDLTGFEPLVIYMPGADPGGQNQILRRVTSLMTDSPQGYLLNNQWLGVIIKKAGESSKEWIPTMDEQLKSNNMDAGDPDSSWVEVKDHKYFPETINIALKESVQWSAFKVRRRDFFIDGIKNQLDALPVIESERLYLPVRFLGYACGLKNEQIHWDEESQTVYLSKADTKLEFTLNKPTQRINGIEQPMDVVPLLRNGRLYLPARYVAAALGYYVDWEPQSQVVYIYTPGLERPANPFN